MPLNSKKLSLVVSTGVFASLIYFGTDYFNHKYLTREVMKPLPPQSVFTSKGVSTRLLKVILDYESVSADAEVATVTANISMPFDYDSTLNYKWKLGEGVSLADASAVRGVIQGMRAGQEIQIKIKVTGFSLEKNHHISFEVTGSLNGRNIHGQALIASDAENTFENTVKNVEQIKSSR